MKSSKISKLFPLSALLVLNCTKASDSQIQQAQQRAPNSEVLVGAPKAASAYPAHLATVEQRTKALASLAPGGTLTSKNIGSCTYPNSTARVVFTPGTPGGSDKEIPLELKNAIQQVISREVAKTNFTISAFSDRLPSDENTVGGGGVAGIISVSMYAPVNNGIQRPGHAMNASAIQILSGDGNCTGQAWGTISFREGEFNAGILVHELGHALGLGHQEGFDWRNRYLMPKFVNSFNYFGSIFLGSKDERSAMAMNETFSEGDVRTLNFLYPTKGGKPREIHTYKPGTEIESGLMVIRGLEERELRVQVPGIDDPIDGLAPGNQSSGPLSTAVRADGKCEFTTEKYYSVQGGVKESGIAADEHYCKFGFKENRVICLPDSRPQDSSIFSLCSKFGGVAQAPPTQSPSVKPQNPTKTNKPLTWREAVGDDHNNLIRSLTTCPAHIVPGAQCDVRGYACDRGLVGSGLVCSADEDLM